jgi:ribose transport system permease protein
MFYIARGVASWIVAGQQLTGWTESYNQIGRKVGDILVYLDLSLVGGLPGEILDVVSVQTIWVAIVAVIAAVILARAHYGYMVYATGGNRRAAGYAGIDTGRVRFKALMFSALCAAMAGCINIAYFRSFNPVAGQFRELDAIAAVIIGGGSIFRGFGTIIGSLAGAAVITLIRALLQLNIITASGATYSLPQHWVNSFVGGILIVAVLIDIWVRQGGLIERLRPRRRPEPGKTANA